MFKVCTLYFEYCNLFIRKDSLSSIKSLTEHLQFMAGQKRNLVGHFILPQIFPIGQNVRCVFHLVGQFLILVGYCPMSNRYFKACLMEDKITSAQFPAQFQYHELTGDN